MSIVRTSATLCFILLAGNVSADDTPTPKTTTTLRSDSKTDEGVLLKGVTMDCAILSDNSAAIIASNSNSTNYTCDIKCDLKTSSGSTANFSCSATLPAAAKDAIICSQSGDFTTILSGSYSCK